MSDNESPIHPDLTGDIPGEVSGKVSGWEKAMSSFLSRFNEYSTFFRQIREPVKDSREGFSDSVSGETTRATRALATMMFRMMTSADPNFYMVALNEMITQDQIEDAETLLTYQEMWLQKRRYLLRACQTMALFGTVGIEEPWTGWPVNRRGPPLYEGTGFFPRSLVQIAFDHTVPEIEMSDWHCLIDFVTPAKLRSLAKSSPDTWDEDAIEDAIEKNTNGSKLPQAVQDRRAKAGYQISNGPVLQLSTYYGSLNDVEGDTDWVIGVVNDQVIVRGHPLSQESGIRPVRFAHYVEHELEPYGYGVGAFGAGLQKDINANRRRMVNLTTFALYHMWKMSRMAGIKPTQLRIRPYGAVETDDINGLEPLRPDLNAFNVGKLLDELLKEEFRGNTGASANLQAIVTEATASESSIAQNESVRNISVQAEIAAEQLVRWHLIVSHKNNLQYLDKPIWLKVTGREKPTKIYPGSLARELEPFIRVTTDKDFRPERLRRAIEALQTLSSIRNQLPPEAVETIVPLVKEIMHGLGVKMRTLQPSSEKSAVEKLAEKAGIAKDLREGAVDEAAAAGMGVGGSPESISVPGTSAEAVLQTPVGPVAGSPA